MKKLFFLFISIAMFHLTIIGQTPSLQKHLSPSSTGLSSSTVYNASNCHIAYPSPLNPSEMASPLSCNTSVNYRGLDTGYMVILGGDFTVPASGGSETEGRMAIGGDFIMHKPATYGVSQSGGGTFVLGDTGNWGLNVHGDLRVTSASGNLNVGDNGRSVGSYKVRVGGSAYLTGSVNADVLDSTSSTDIDITSILNTVSETSDSMRRATPTVTVSSLGPSYGPTLVGTDSDIEIFNIDGSQLNQVGYVTTITFIDSIKAGATIILNVSGTKVDVGYVLAVGRVNDPNNDAAADDDAVVHNVLWNFFEADTINLINDLNGTIFAPESEYISIHGNVNGRIYASGDINFIGSNKEIHNFPFDGDITSFYPTSGTPVPVLWLDFIAETEGMQNVKLKWSTALEINNERFEVERSRDARQFKTIGSIPGAGNSSSVREYTFSDSFVGPEVAYYRIKQIDFDGKSSYTDFERVAFHKVGHIKLSPNPTHGKVNISIPEETFDVTVRLVNIQGVMLETISSKEGGDLEVDLKDYDNGIYFITVTYEKNQRSFRVIKTN
jgi:choice-of-anchor A domain-containing protein